MKDFGSNLNTLLRRLFFLAGAASTYERLRLQILYDYLINQQLRSMIPNVIPLGEQFFQTGPMVWLRLKCQFVNILNTDL